MDKSTIITRHFYTTPLVTDSTRRHKISKNIEDLNSTMNQLELTDIYKTPPNNSKTQTFSSAHHISMKIDHILGQKQVSASMDSSK